MVKTEISGDVTVCSFEDTNKLNALVSEQVKKEIGGIFDKSGAKVIIDMDNIAFIDSSGFSALISILRKARNNNGVLHLCNISPEMMKLFNLLQLHNVFHICPDRNDCIKGFGR